MSSRALQQGNGNFIYQLIIFLTIMDYERPLDAILGTRSSVRLLRALVALPEGLSVSARDLARRASISSPSALSALRMLHEQGVLEVRRAPKRDAYSLNRNHIVSQQLIRLFEFEEELQARLQEFLTGELRRRFPHARLALLFGSAAEHRASASSDIDIFLLTKKDQNIEEDVLDFGDSVQKAFGNRASVIVEDISKKDFLNKAKRNRLWSQVLEKGIPLVGRI